ncbi:phosphopantetheine-binding protein [Cephaloticoccus primus]|uniref:phosphopantetheine-binding protein n=1 Tax=Cephaloticoccus primus TaxID=1548207 RepID=UPI00083850FB|nr:phosphopantetheine-binding protein [Cephaloticoccus primus]
MTDVNASVSPAGNRPADKQPRPFSAEDEVALRESLKRCSSATLEAALKFLKTGDVEPLPTVVIGVIERFVDPDLRPKLQEGNDELRLIEDLGIDSLTMMEIVILVEETLRMTINNDELRNLRTVGDIKVFIDCKARGLPPPQPAKFLPIEQIAAVMPIQPPFLFLNEASISSTHASAKYKITGEEFFLKGHFKNNPVLPASIMLEALGQLAVLYLLEGFEPTEAGKVVNAEQIFFTGCEGVRAHRVCRPGDVLSLSIRPKRAKMPLATFEGAIRVGQEKTAIAEEITLTFGLKDAPAPAAAPEAEASAASGGAGGAAPASVVAPASPATTGTTSSSSPTA